MTLSSALKPPLKESPEQCPACDHSGRKRLGPVRYGSNALVADQDASDLVERLGRIELLACESCGFRWTDPQYSMDAVVDLYRQNTEQHWEAEGRDWNQYVKRIGPSLPKGGAALDVGCYTGDFLSVLGEGWHLHGIEPIPFAVKHAREKGINVHEGTLEDAQYPPDSFDLITLWDVAEHLQDPLGAFSRLAEWLKPGGILALETGNADCSFARRMGADWWYVALLEHCSFYTPTAMERLLSRCGLKLESWQPTCHHKMSLPKLTVQLGKAWLYRRVSLAAERGAGWAANGPASRLLRKHAPCAMMKDHLFAVARKA